jgi:hypothetical protein
MDIIPIKFDSHALQFGNIEVILAVNLEYEVCVQQLGNLLLEGGFGPIRIQRAIFPPISSVATIVRSLEAILVFVW